MEMGNRIKRTVQGHQRKVYRGTNLENLLTNAINKSQDRYIRLCIRSMSITEAPR